MYAHTLKTPVFRVTLAGSHVHNTHVHRHGPRGLTHLQLKSASACSPIPTSHMQTACHDPQGLPDLLLGANRHRPSPGGRRKGGLGSSAGGQGQNRHFHPFGVRLQSPGEQSCA